MIGRLTGFARDEEDGSTIVDVGGVGYDVHVPLGTLGRAIKDPEGRVTLHVHTHVREDALMLYAFASESERLAFRTLISVSNVGPKIALAVLSALPAAELARAIAAKDVPKLTSISGVGKKTAERLVLELKDKLPTSPTAVATSSQATPSKAAASSSDELLLGALTRLGYRPIEAERAIAQLGPARFEGAPLADLVREALALLAK